VAFEGVGVGWGVHGGGFGRMRGTETFCAMECDAVMSEVCF